MGKKRAKLNRLNWDVEYVHSILSGNGFAITEPATVNIGGSKKKTLYGPRSELYGTTYGDEQEFAEQNKCKCGRLIGMQHIGEQCSFCGHIVTKAGDNIKMTGWIVIPNGYVINPQYFRILQSAIGKQIFPDIITSRNKVDKDGIISENPYSDPDKPPLSPFSGIGIDGFRERYYEILDYFYNKKKGGKKNPNRNKIKKRFDNLKRDARSVFTSHIPVYTTKLRQQSITGDTFYFKGIDKHINTIISLTMLLEECSPIERPNYLQNIQKKLNLMWDENFSLLNSKEGFIRGQMLGGSLNYTARNVIVPDHTLHDDEVDISYHTFLELFKEQIIKYLMQTEDILLSDALAEWKMASVIFDEKIYAIMNQIVEKTKPHIVLNRNPTLDRIEVIKQH